MKSVLIWITKTNVPKQVPIRATSTLNIFWKKKLSGRVNNNEKGKLYFPPRVNSTSIERGRMKQLK